MNIAREMELNRREVESRRVTRQIVWLLIVQVVTTSIVLMGVYDRGSFNVITLISTILGLVSLGRILWLIKRQIPLRREIKRLRSSN
jgi:hypothetical protein